VELNKLRIAGLFAQGSL